MEKRESIDINLFMISFFDIIITGRQGFMNNKETPLYKGIYDDLKKKITENVYKENTALPTEIELIDKYHVSRITMRRALSDLEHDGLIKRTRGKGTIVLPKKKYRDLYQLKSFSEEARENNDVPTSIIIKCEVQPCSANVAEMLDINPDENVYYLCRLRLINGRINGVFETYISQRFGFEIDTENFSGDQSLYDFYESNGIVIGEANETIEAIMTPAHIKKMMFLEEDEPIFYRERVTFDINGTPIEFSRNYYKANGYKYFIKMHR